VPLQAARIRRIQLRLFAEPGAPILPHFTFAFLRLRFLAIMSLPSKKNGNDYDSVPDSVPSVPPNVRFVNPAIADTEQQGEQGAWH